MDRTGKEINSMSKFGGMVQIMLDDETLNDS